MRTKIILVEGIVAVVVAMMFVGTAAGYGVINTETDITATNFASSSYLSVINMPIKESYTSQLIAEFVYPIFPPVDLSYLDMQVSGETFSGSTEASSTPTGSSTSVAISNPSAVSGYIFSYTCVDIGSGTYGNWYDLPQGSGDEAAEINWGSSHPEGSALPTQYSEVHTITWP